MSTEIILNEGGHFFYPGQTIVGRVECYFNKEKYVRAVRIQFKGEAKVDWTEQMEYTPGMQFEDSLKIINYTAKETYFKVDYDLASESEAREGAVLPKGRHVFPFSYVLPLNIPASFNGDHGSICYSIDVTVDRPWKFNYVASILFNVGTYMDASHIHGLEPLDVSRDEYLCGCCHPSPLTFDVSIPTKGCIVGHIIHIDAYMKNSPMSNVKGMKFAVVKNIEYVVKQPVEKSKYESHTITKSLDGSIWCLDDGTWNSSVSLAIQSFPNLNCCNIINVNYHLKLELYLSCIHKKFCTYIPITMDRVSGFGLPGWIPPVKPKFKPLPCLPLNYYPFGRYLPPAYNTVVAANEARAAPEPHSFAQHSISPHPYYMTYPPPYSYAEEGPSTSFNFSAATHQPHPLPQRQALQDEAGMSENQ